jgi:hypothetical protein
MLARKKEDKMQIKFTDLNMPAGLVEASLEVMEKREPIIINPEMHNMDTVQRLQMGEGLKQQGDDEVPGQAKAPGADGKEIDDTREKDQAKDIQKALADKKHEFYEDTLKECPACGKPHYRT